MKPETCDSASMSPMAASSLMGACLSCSLLIAPVLQQRGEHMSMQQLAVKRYADL